MDEKFKDGKEKETIEKKSVSLSFSYKDARINMRKQGFFSLFEYESMHDETGKVRR